MEPKEWYKASELLNELEEKGVTKGKCYGKCRIAEKKPKIIKSEFVFINMDFFHFT